jgi:hypothetical protein
MHVGAVAHSIGTFSRLSQDSDKRPSSASPVAISEFLRRRMEVTDATTRALLREYLEDLLHKTTTYAIQTPSREKLIATLLALDNAPLPTCPPPIQSHYWRALLPETPIWHWDQTTAGAALQSTHELEVTPFSPTTLMSLGTALSSTKIVHTVFSTQPYKNARPFYALPQGELNAVALAVTKIIGEIATRFNDMYPLYVLASSHNSAQQQQ